MSVNLSIHTLNGLTGEDIINKFLINQCNILRLYFEKYPKKLNTEIKNCAVIIEPRSNHLLLEAVCRNVMYFLPSDWDLVVFSHNEKIVKNRLKNLDFIFHETKDNLTMSEYNDLMLSTNFWEKIPSEHILIFQTDSYITKKTTQDYLDSIKEFPFIGAIYKIGPDVGKCNLCPDDRNISINGGFSYRSKSAMIDCLDKITHKNIVEYRLKQNLFIFDLLTHEDVFFEHALFLLGYKLPRENECSKFCCQVIYNFENSFAVHGINKSLVYKDFVFHLRPSLIELYEEIIT